MPDVNPVLSQEELDRIRDKLAMAELRARECGCNDPADHLTGSRTDLHGNLVALVRHAEALAEERDAHYDDARRLERMFTNASNAEKGQRSRAEAAEKERDAALSTADGALGDLEAAQKRAERLAGALWVLLEASEANHHVDNDAVHHGECGSAIDACKVKWLRDGCPDCDALGKVQDETRAALEGSESDGA